MYYSADDDVNPSIHVGDDDDGGVDDDDDEDDDEDGDDDDGDDKDDDCDDDCDDDGGVNDGDDNDDYDDDDGDDDGDDDDEADDERKMMTLMCRRRRKMMRLRRMMLRRKTDPKTGKHTLCGPAQATCACTFHNSHVAWKFTGIMAAEHLRRHCFVRACAGDMRMDISQEPMLYRNLPEKWPRTPPGTSFCASLRRRHAHGHFTRAHVV